MTAEADGLRRIFPLPALVQLTQCQLQRTVPRHPVIERQYPPRMLRLVEQLTQTGHLFKSRNNRFFHHNARTG